MIFHHHHVSRPETALNGSALVLTLVLSAIALAVLASAIAWSGSNARLNDRTVRYNQAVVAAEGATEKVITQLSKDYLSSGQRLVVNNAGSYRQSVPSAADSAYWADWEFSDGQANRNKTYVDIGTSSTYVVLNSTFAGLKGYATTCTIVSNARQPNGYASVTGAVLQQIQLAVIPIFQFAMYTSGDMEVSCGQPFTITGRVHSNGQLYIEPDAALTFLSSVTSVGAVHLLQRSPLDCRSAPVGTAVFGIQPCLASALTLPIGLTNTPLSVREITQPPPGGENPRSALGRMRYYNLTDMMVTVDNTNLTVTSGAFNNFATIVPTNQWQLFVSTNASFWDEREAKTVMPVDLNVGLLRLWSATNANVRAALGGLDVFSIYVRDRRILAATRLGAVRVTNGRQLPPRGLTIATDRPIYVLGNFNQSSDANLGSTNTVTTLPASFAGDAITILSTNWTDGNSHALLSSRNAGPTTVNAGILAGAVETANCHYGGGMENFPRFLESWGSSNPFAYNGSMVKMFPSLYATNIWGKTNVYDPPKRLWSYDYNFDEPTKLPPLTPGLQNVIRGTWATIPPNQTTLATAH